MEKRVNKYIFILTDSAITKIRESFLNRGTPESFLRIGVKGGFCAGFGYILEFCDEEPNEKDLIFDFDGIKILIDKKSIIYLNGCTLNWKKSLMEQGYEFLNPNAVGTCGCKISFSI